MTEWQHLLNALGATANRDYICSGLTNGESALWNCRKCFRLRQRTTRAMLNERVAKLESAGAGALLERAVDRALEPVIQREQE